MPGSFTESVDARLSPFDPEGSGYDEATAYQIIANEPPLPDKPLKPRVPIYSKGVPRFEEVAREGAFKGWVWHPKENEWVAHKGSFHPESRRLLKGIKHPTIEETFAQEAKIGNEIVKRDDGYYYSQPKKK